MQVNVTQDVAVKQYAQTAQNVEKVSSATAEKTVWKGNGFHRSETGYGSRRI